MRPSLSQIYRGTVTTAYLGRALTPYVLEDVDKLALRSDVVFVIMQGYSISMRFHRKSLWDSHQIGGTWRLNDDTTRVEHQDSLFITAHLKHEVLLMAIALAVTGENMFTISVYWALSPSPEVAEKKTPDCHTGFIPLHILPDNVFLTHLFCRVHHRSSIHLHLRCALERLLQLREHNRLRIPRQRQLVSISLCVKVNRRLPQWH